MKKLMITLGMFATFCTTEAKVTLPALFTDNMVLQQKVRYNPSRALDEPKRGYGDNRLGQAYLYGPNRQARELENRNLYPLCRRTLRN